MSFETHSWAKRELRRAGRRLTAGMAWMALLCLLAHGVLHPGSGCDSRDRRREPRGDPACMHQGGSRERAGDFPCAPVDSPESKAGDSCLICILLQNGIMQLPGAADGAPLPRHQPEITLEVESILFADSPVLSCASPRAPPLRPASLNLF